MQVDESRAGVEPEDHALAPEGDEAKPAKTSITIGDISASQGGTVVIAGRDARIGYSAEQVEKLLDRLGREFQPKPFTGKCPYPGLEAFREADASLFFGRETQIAGLLERMRTARFLMIAGPSGSGKSSLVRAGLLSKLKSGALPGSETWLYATLQPGRQPLEALALGMSRAGRSPHAAEYLRTHASQANALNEVAESLLGDDPSQRLILFVDQFEEIFTQTSDEHQAERLAFLDLLTTAATVENGRLTVVCAMRSDFLLNCAPYARLNALLNQQFFQLGALQPDELVRAIALPASEVGLRLDPKLVAQVVEDVGSEPGILPLMQFALKDLFEVSQSVGGVPELTLEGYLQRGGLHKALQRHAEAEFARLNAAEQKLAESVFSSLVEINLGAQNTRRTARFSELVPSDVESSLVRDLVLRLSNARLLTTDEVEGQEAVVFIPHERLLDAWPWLHNLVEENRQVIALKNKIDDDAQEWEVNERNPSYLYTGARLATADEQLKAQHLRLSSLGQEFIQAGISQATRQKRIVERRRNILLASSIFITLVLAILTFWALNRTQASLRLSKISLSRQLAAQAVDSLAIQKPIDLSLLLAVESWRVVQEGNLGVIVETDDALRRTLAEAPQWMVRHGDGVLAIAFSPDGRAIATGSLDGTARLWDAASSSELAVLDHGEAVTAVAFSPDSKRLATGSEKGVVRVWTLGSSQEPMLLHDEFDPDVKRVFFSPNGRWLMATYLDPDLGRRGIRLWDTLAGSEWLPPDDCYPGYDVAFSPQGDRLAVGGMIGTCVLDASTGQVLGILGKEFNFEAKKVQFNQDGSLLLSSDKGNATLWEVETYKKRAGWEDQEAINYTLSPDGVRLAIVEEGVRLSPEGLPADNLLEDFKVVVRDTHTGRDLASMHFNSPVDGVQFLEGSSRLVTWNQDGSLRVWDAGLGSLITEYRHGYGLSGLVLGEDGKRLASAGGYKVHVWELAQGGGFYPPGITMISRLRGVDLTTFLPYRPVVDLGIFRHDSPITGLGMNPDGSRLATSSLDSTARLWDARGGQEPLSIRHDVHVDGFALVGDGTRLVSSSDNILHYQDIFTGKEVFNPVQLGYSAEVAASPDGNLVTTYNVLENQVLVWSLNQGTVLAILQHQDSINQAVFSPDGASLATASSDDSVCIWQAESGKKLACLPHEAPVWQVVWSADSKRLATRTNGIVRIWDAYNFSELNSITGAKNYTALAIDARGDLLGTTTKDSEVQVWNLTQNQMIARFSHRDYVYTTAFSPDGSVLATGSGDGTAGLWNSHTGQSLAFLRHSDTVSKLAFSSDGNRLVTSMDGETVYVWRVHTQDLADQACQIAGRNLTQEEWAQYLGEQPYRKTCPQWP